MNKKLKKVLIPLICIISAVGVFFLGFLTRQLTYSKNQKAVLNILDKYEKYYYYQDENVIDIISDAIFDKYSTYLSKEEYEKVLKEASGEYYGLGLAFSENSTQIEKVIINSSSYKAGVKVGGNIVKMKSNGQEKISQTADGFISFLDTVSNGELIELTVNYGGEEEVYTVQKTAYKKSYVTYIDADGEYAFIDNGGLSFQKVNQTGLSLNSTSYIRYEQFSGRGSGLDGSVSQLKTALNAFKQKSNKNLILDLRDNGGGYMDILCEVAGLFVERDGNKQVISIAKDKYDKTENFYIKNNLYDSYGFEKIIVLANENTASASEVLIGAMLDYDTQNKVTVVLDGHIKNEQTVYKTYGKGIMQTTYKNLDNSAVKLTTAQIFWPKSNISIHGVGITENTSTKVKNATLGDAFEFAINLLKK